MKRSTMYRVGGVAMKCTAKELERIIVKLEAFQNKHSVPATAMEDIVKAKNALMLALECIEQEAK